jgi:hypothetical protein
MFEIEDFLLAADRTFRALAARQMTETYFTDWLGSHTELTEP